MSNHRATLDGQESAMSTPNYMYFSNLRDLLTAVCQNSED